jgi:hypothetical protein
MRFLSFFSELTFYLLLFVVTTNLHAQNAARKGVEIN